VSRCARGALAALAAAALLAGCGSDETATTAAPPATTTATEPAPSPPPAPPANAVRFKAADGETVTGEYRPAGKDAPGVVLLHEIRGGPDQWEPLAGYLHEAGFATLAYQSRAGALESERLPDALAALRWLRKRPDVEPRRINLVGASIGASTAVLAMATRARRLAAAAVALSPPDSSDIWALQGENRYRPHDMLLVSDDRESTSAEGMLEGAVRSKALRSHNPGHGITLLGEAGVRDALLAWLKDRVAR
jgi:pimeloyl-ACP methyl ester carboxylesterase